MKTNKIIENGELQKDLNLLKRSLISFRKSPVNPTAVTGNIQLFGELIICAKMFPWRSWRLTNP